MTVGERIKEVRELKGMSQDELAKRMGYKDRSSISKIEKDNDDNISMNTVQKAATILNCSPLYLMGWSEESSLGESNAPEHLEKYREIINQYAKLNDHDRDLVDNLIMTLSKG